MGAVDPPAPGRSENQWLRDQLQRTARTAQVAFRDSSRLIRLLTVIGEPAPPEELVQRTLASLSDVFVAEICCLVYSDGEAVEVVSACGFGEDVAPWVPELPGAPDVIGRRGLVAWTCPEGVEVELGGVPVRAVANVPLTDGGSAGEALVLFRVDAAPFGPGELQMLQSVAYRLRAAIDEGQRREAIERLVRAGHRFTRHLDTGPLFEEAMAVLRDMTGATSAAAVAVQDGMSRLIGAQPLEMREALAPTFPWAVGALPAWPVVQRGEPYAVDDLTEASAGGTPGPGGSRSLICVPVTDEGVVVALLFAGHPRPAHFSRAKVEAAAVLAGYVGAALLNARLYGALSEREAELRDLTEELGRRATHDSLTGLANRDLARQLLQASLASAEDGMVGLLFIDLDKFKAVNDRLGHEAGDDLLRQVARRLEECLRGGDLLARLGGDEFLIVLPRVWGLDDVTAVGHRVLAELNEPFPLRGERVRVGASLGGVVSERDPGEKGDVTLLRDADAAMYEAKNRGRGRVEVFDRLTAQRAVDRLALREDLLTALERDQFELAYQPIVDLDDEHVTGFEALLRWRHPTLGMISPVDFIPMAEETGAITVIGDWVLEEACAQLALWHEEFGASMSVAVNVSAVQLLDGDFARRCIRTIRAAGLTPQQVWLEVTENIEVTGHVIDQLRLLRDVGVRVALDDFGMSYSNLGYLKRLPVERLKIDKSFVDGLGARSDPASGETGDRMDRGIVRAIMAIAESVGMSVVAEGIETEEQRQVLRDLGCRRGQGFLFARPMPAADAGDLLAEAANLLTEQAEAAVGRSVG